MRSELERFFAFINGRSPLEIEFYRQRGEPLAREGLLAATAFSAIEQAMWDLSGKALDVPTYVLLAGKIRSMLPVYANINRATNPRTPVGFATAAKRAVADGFSAIKGRRSTDSRRRRLRPQRSHVRSTRASTPCAQCAPRLAPPSPS